MKRYLLFTGLEHFPPGGWSDLYSSFDSDANAVGKGLSMLHDGECDWIQVVDSVTGELAFEEGT